MLQCFPCFCFYYIVLQHIHVHIYTYKHIHINDVVFDVLSRLRKLTFNVFRLLCSYACTCTVCQCQCQCQSQTRPDQCERECGYVNGHVFVYHNKLTYLITGFLHSLKKTFTFGSLLINVLSIYGLLYGLSELCD